jgi:hypothetical protein
MSSGGLTEMNDWRRMTESPVQPPNTDPLPAPEPTPDPNPLEPPLPLPKEDRTWERQDPQKRPPEA